MDESYEINGLVGDGPLPSLAGSESGPCLVLGGAAIVWEDIRAAFSLCGSEFLNVDTFETEPFKMLAVNIIGMAFRPKVDHLVTHHEDLLEPVIRLRNFRNGFNRDKVATHCQNPTSQTKKKTHWPAETMWRFGQGCGGTSTMLACMVGLALGHSRVILCGTPLDSSPHFFEPAFADLGNMFNSRTQAIEWNNAEWMGGRVRSMSGRSRDWLGFPNKRWINGE